MSSDRSDAPSPPRPRVLFVDAELDVLEPIVRVLRRRFEVVTSSDPVAALGAIRIDPHFATVIVDLRMPGMDGITFLSQIREVAPEAIPMVFTGRATVQSAIDAVNRGHVFRFVLRPCPPEVLLEAIQACLTQFERLQADRALLEQTLQGSIVTLVDVLGLALPEAFGRADRVKRLVVLLAGTVEMPNRWELEVAALLADLGSIGMPPALLEKLATGALLSEAEATLVAERPALAARLLASIPRLEGVRTILQSVGLPFEPAMGGPPLRAREAPPIGARLLTLVLDFDQLESRGITAVEAIRILRGRTSRYDPALLATLAAEYEPGDPEVIREVTLADVVPGMVFAADVRSVDGGLMISRGQEVTASLVSRIRNYWTEIPVQSTVRVRLPRLPLPG